MKLDGKIFITAKTARVALDNLSEWLSDSLELTAETRQMVIALDELITALDAEEYLEAKERERQEQNRKMHEEWRERQEAQKAAELSANVAAFIEDCKSDKTGAN